MDCKVSKLKEATMLFKQMRDSGHVPDLITYAILVDKFSKVGQPLEANRLLHETLK